MTHAQSSNADVIGETFVEAAGLVCGVAGWIKAGAFLFHALGPSSSSLAFCAKSAVAFVSSSPAFFLSGVIGGGAALTTIGCLCILKTLGMAALGFDTGKAAVRPRPVNARLNTRLAV